VKRFGLVVLFFSAVGFSQTNNAVANQKRVLRIGVRSDVRFIITDPNGRSAGFDRNTGLATTQIPLSSPDETCSLAPSMAHGAKPCYRQMEISNPVPGLYRMQIMAAQSGRYGLYWSDKMHANMSGREYSNLPIDTGELQIYDFMVGATGSGDSIRGDFTGNKAAGEADQLLTWGRPNSEKVNLRPGEKSYDAIIVYGTTVIPNSFRARMNDEDLKNLFHPEPGRIESVSLPLRTGRNILKVMMDGTVNSTRVTDTDTLELTVP